MARDTTEASVEAANASDDADTPSQSSKGLTCGLVMPLAMTDNCSPQHWSEVRTIIQEAVQSIGEYDFHCDMVSSANESAVIQTSIVQNLNSNDIVVCDVSGKNPNVMFELGMRVAFDKPVVVIKDDKTDFSFDTSPIAHLIYPRDLRYAAMQAFKASLAAKVAATYKKHVEGGSGSSYLASFGPIKVAHLQTQEVPLSELLLSKLSDMQDQLNSVVVATQHAGLIAWSPKQKNRLYEAAMRGHKDNAVDSPLDEQDLNELRKEIKKALGGYTRISPVAIKKAEFVVETHRPSWSAEKVGDYARAILHSIVD